MLGVLGGMGPAATADFYRKLVAATPAARDQDHIPIVIIGDPRIADRSQAIESGNTETVLAGMVQRIRSLEALDVDAIAIPCNTAHFWLPSLEQETKIPFISLVEASASEAKRRAPTGKAALVLGTRATVRSRLYEPALAGQGFRLVMPTEQQQTVVDALIAGVKSGAMEEATRLFRSSVLEWLSHADVVLLACTELPLVAGEWLHTHPTMIDTTAALVSACIAWAEMDTR
jgi:aspartate racemase